MHLLDNERAEAVLEESDDEVMYYSGVDGDDLATAADLDNGDDDISSDDQGAIPCADLTGDETPPLDLDFNELCTDLRDEMLHLAMKLARSRADADDVVQAAMIKAYRAWPRFWPADNENVRMCARSWLIRIVANTYYSLFRDRRRHGQLVVDKHQDVVDELYASSTYVKTKHVDGHYHSEPRVYSFYLCATNTDYEGDIGDEVRTAMARLTPQQRELVTALYFDGLSYPEIVKKFNLPRGTISSRLNRAHAILQKALREYARDEYRIKGGQ